LQGLFELLCFVGGERAEEGLLCLLGGPGGPPGDVLPGVGEFDDVLAAVVWVLASPDEASFLEVVDQRDHGGAVDAHPAGDLSLGQPMREVDRAEHGGFPSVDPGGRERGRGELEKPHLHMLEQVPEMAGHGDGRPAAAWRAVWDPGGHDSKAMD
jgi:hypothetical protein